MLPNSDPLAVEERDQRNQRYQRYCRAFTGRSGPLAFVDLAAFDANAVAIAARAGGKPIRLASKSLRCVDLLRRALNSHPAYQGVMCFSAREAAHLAGHGLNNLLIAYPTVDAQAIREVARLSALGHDLTCMVDCPEHLIPLEMAAQAYGTCLQVCLDLDVSQDYPPRFSNATNASNVSLASNAALVLRWSGQPGLRFGTYRSPLQRVPEVLALARRIADSPYLRLVGVMAYEGQVAGLGDVGRDPKTRMIRHLKRRAVPQVARRRAEVVRALREAGHELRFVNGGGTGSLETTSAEDEVTEVAMGSGLYSPTLFDAYQGFQHHPAVGFALNVTRQPAPGIVTCHGGGYVASGSAGSSRLPMPYLPAGLTLLPHEGAGEVQTPLRVPPDAALNGLKVGDLVFFRHAKAGELCEHFNELHAVQHDEIIGTFKTYRGEGRCFP